MKRILHNGFQTIEIVRWHENHSTDTVLDFSDVHNAHAFLSQFLSDPWAIQTLRHVLAEEDAFVSLSHVSDQETLQRIAFHVVSRRIRLAVRKEMLRSVPARGGQPAPPPTVTEEAPLAETKTWIKIQVVHDATGIPIPGIALNVILPDGTHGAYNTGTEGWFEINALEPGTCDVTCDIQGVRLRETYAFVAMGKIPRAEVEDSSEAPSSTTDAEDAEEAPTRSRIALIKTHKVRSGESIKSIAEANGMTWQELAEFNWDTSVPDEINEHLRDEVGCTKKTPDGYNYSFDDADDPGLLYIPSPWTQTGLATEQTHTIRVRQADGFRIILENEYGLRIPFVEYEATLADGSKQQGHLGKSGIALIEDPPRGEIAVDFLDYDDIEAKSLAACARKAFDDRDPQQLFRVLKHSKTMIQQTVAAYDEHFNDYTGNGLLADLDQELTDREARHVGAFLLGLADLELPSSAGK